ncbi:HNH endonuclease family protein [Alginatibacterium sediminis]|uniref:hypothetical protein n=1 Tax=Alginatibacterium sediminis TaxID=2164068 RepID=UPI0011C40DED|nr:hypothetical protein [Alginatibacterium sediminis]
MSSKLLKILPVFAVIFSLFLSSSSWAQVGNHSISSFPKAKRTLEREVYQDSRQTLYCQAQFDSHKNVFPPAGFHTEKYVKRAQRIEWEHIL